MEVVSQLHTPATLPLEKTLRSVWRD